MREQAIDLGLELDNVDVSAGLVGPDGPAQQQMAALMSSTFAAFARTGNPDVPGAPHWPAYDPVKRETFIYDIPAKVVADPNSDTRVLWSELAKKMGPTSAASSPVKDALDPKHINKENAK